MSCVVRCGPHCHRMVVKVKNIKALKETEIQRIVCQRVGQQRLWKPQKLEQYIRLCGYISPLSKFVILFFPGKSPSSFATLPGNASAWSCLIASDHVGILLCTCWALLTAWGLTDTPIFPGSPKDILLDFFFFFCELGTKQFQWHEGCASPGPGMGWALRHWGKLLRISSLSVVKKLHIWQETFLPHSYWCVHLLLFFSSAGNRAESCLSFLPLPLFQKVQKVHFW